MPFRFKAEALFRSPRFKRAARPALVLAACVWLAGCGGGGSGGGEQVTIMPDPPSPDLVVESPLVSDPAPAAGAGFRLSATVRNAGGGPAAAKVRFYRSADATISRADTPVGEDDAGELAASEEKVASVDVNAPSTPGAYYYGACADEAPGESDVANNCSPSARVDVSAEQTPPPGPQASPSRPSAPAPAPVPAPEPARPDLAVVLQKAVPHDPTVGGGFYLKAAVRNVGDARSARVFLRFYRSDDTTITRSDEPVGVDYFGALNGGEITPYFLQVSLSSPSPGTYYYGACVDAAPGETNDGNNCSPPVKVKVSEKAPDLKFTQFELNTYPLGPPKGKFRPNASIRNVGGNYDQSEADVWLRFYRSDDETITRSDTEVGAVKVTIIGQDVYRWFHGWVDLPLPTTAGTYYYGACVDAAPGETNDGNNCSWRRTLTVE